MNGIFSPGLFNSNLIFMYDEINYAMIPSDEFLTFGQRLTGIYGVIGTGNDTYGLLPFVTKAVNAYSDYSKAFERESTNPYTKELAGNDNQRDGSFYGFRHYLISCSFRRTEGWSAAAKRILDIFRKHGWSAPHFGYKIETEVITKIIDEITSNCSAEMALLDPAADWLNELKEAQTWFEDTQKKSVTRPTTGELTITQTRPVLTDRIRKLLDFTMLQFSEHTNDAQLAGLVSAVNELVDVTMTTVRANATRQENAKKKDQ